MKLPKTILMYPMTLASQAAHMVMRFQQNLAELVIKGDSTLESHVSAEERKAGLGDVRRGLARGCRWAAALRRPGRRRQRSPGRGTVRLVLGIRHDLRLEAADPPTKPVPVRQPKKSASKSTVPQPAVAADLDYPTLTLAQLRARLQSLDVDELEALLAYEQATKARAPFQTLLANRITRATAK